jgi:small subunit ribosomal protein S16
MAALLQSAALPRPQLAFRASVADASALRAVRLAAAANASAPRARRLCARLCARSVCELARLAPCRNLTPPRPRPPPRPQAPRAAAAAAPRAALLVEARVAIRFARFGRKKLPFYRLVAIDSRARRDGKPLEYLGWYDPLRKETNLNAPAIKKWLGVGALPSETVGRLLKKAMIVE